MMDYLTRTSPTLKRGRSTCPSSQRRQSIVFSAPPPFQIKPSCLHLLETVYDIKYFSRDQRRNRPPIKRTVLKKANIQKMMAEQTFDVNDFPKPYLTAKVKEDDNPIGGGYKKLGLRFEEITATKICGSNVFQGGEFSGRNEEMEDESVKREAVRVRSSSSTFSGHTDTMATWSLAI
nr:Villin-1 like [Ipomoea batatas]